MPGDVTTDHRPFDYAHPPCTASLRPAQPDEVDLRYLGAGGIFLGWRGTAVLFGPFFSNPSLLANLFGNYHHDRERIAAHLRGVPLASVRAIVTGHSHYDHLGDVPVVAAMAPEAGIYVNSTGTAMLGAYSSLQQRLHAVRPEEPFTIADAGGAAAIRIRPVASDHAPQLCRSRRWPCNISACRVEQPWTSDFENQAPRDFCGGDTFAYVVDFLDGDGRVAFRLYYNDSAPEAPRGVPAGDGVPYDVAILTVASYFHVHGYPEAVLAGVRPRYALLTHYEDFFSKSEGRWRFVALLSAKKAKRFVERAVSSGTISGELAPEPPVCGAAGAGWTMPVPGEQMRFHARGGN